jgi:hypothetical protein
VLVVTIHATGLEPDREHYQHIHGNPGGAVICPVAAGGVISVNQGLEQVGPVALDLQPYAQIGASRAEDWSQSYTLGSDQMYFLTPLTGHVLVLHGMTTAGAYNRATFVACGGIRAT